jgi:hypothetical protein
MKTSRSMGLLLSVTVASMAVLGTQVTAGAQPSGPPRSLTCDGAWHIATSDNPSSRDDELNAVAPVSPSFAWAVGEQYGENGILRTLIERWDGTSWVSVPSPSVGHLNELFGAAAPDTTHAFAVGERLGRGYRARTLIEQYTGASWEIVPSPNAGPGDDFLTGVAAVAANDAWAVGVRTRTSGGHAPLVEQWDGTSWSIVPSPRHHGSSETSLSDVAAVSSTDVWAVGTYYAGQKHQYQPFAEHWDGNLWSKVPVASPGVNFSLSSLTAIATDDVWAVGYSSSGGGPFADHWNGLSWSVVATTNPGPNSLLLGVAVAGDSLYATGVADPGPENTLAEMWTGASFQVMSTPNVNGDTFDNVLHRAASDGTTVWAVGNHGTHRGVNTMVEYVC